MTTRWPAGRLHTAFSITVHPGVSRQLVVSRLGHIRHYAQKPTSQHQPDGVTSTPADPPKTDPVKTALTIIESGAKADPINPPRSTRPPPLSLPTRGDEAIFMYWYRIGRAYGTFYKDGIKAVWFNYKASNILKQRIKDDHGSEAARDVTNAIAKKSITRSEFQLLERNSHDIGKLPVFGLLVLIFGEWLVFVVPFVPNRVPGTCRIPKQVRGMRLKAEERRRISFRQGITEPSKEQLPVVNADGDKNTTKPWPIAFSQEYRRSILASLRDDQLHHLSSSLGLHGRTWDRIQLPPPMSLLRRALDRRLKYIAQDDVLLYQNGGTSQLTTDEVHIACEERGLDILGKNEELLRKELSWWLKRQQEDGGNGHALFTMLFRRPNAWDTPKKRS